MKAQHNTKVLFCYGDFIPESVKNRDYVIIEPAHFSKADIALLKKNNQQVLGYISLGEVNEAAYYFEELKEYTQGKNDLWNSYYLSLNKPEIIPILYKIFKKEITEKGVDGLFLDNIDNYTVFGPNFNQKEALVAFLEKMRLEFPDSFFMQNAGLSILKETQDYVDAVAVESVASDYNFERKEYKLREQAEFEKRIKTIEQIEKNIKLPIIFIEYANKTRLAQKIVERLQPMGWSYFIGNIDLQSLPNFKKSK